MSKDCKLPQIISQTLTSDGVLTQILPESTSCKIASDYSSVVLKDSVAETTKVINVRVFYGSVLNIITRPSRKFITLCTYKEILSILV